MRDANVTTRPCGSASGAYRGMWQHHLGHHGPAWCQRGAKDKWAKWIGPTGIVGPVSGIVKGGGRTKPSGQRKL